MAEKLSDDYADYFINNNIAKEVVPMMATIDNIQTRVVEIENVFIPAIRHDSEVATDNCNQILQLKGSFDEICTRIDRLELLVSRTKEDLNKLETQTEIAADELRFPDNKMSTTILKSINLFLNPQGNSPATNLSNGIYKPLEIFKTRDFFDKD